MRLMSTNVFSVIMALPARVKMVRVKIPMVHTTVSVTRATMVNTASWITTTAFLIGVKMAARVSTRLESIRVVVLEDLLGLIVDMTLTSVCPTRVRMVQSVRITLTRTPVHVDLGLAASTVDITIMTVQTGMVDLIARLKMSFTF